MTEPASGLSATPVELNPSGSVDALPPHTADVDCWCQPSIRDGRMRHHMTAPTEGGSNV